MSTATTRTLTTLVTLVAATIALALPAAAGAAPPRAFFGVMANGPLDQQNVDLDAQAAKMRANGVAAWRVEFSWDLVEPQPGSYDWSAGDRKVLAAARAGIDVLGLAVRAPAWANGGSGDPFVPARDPKRYAAFLTALIGRYGPSGSLWGEHPEVPKRPVRTWEMWNEPNLRNYFHVPASKWPSRYAALVRAAYPAIKKADPKAKALLASMANYSWRDLAKLLDSGGPRLRFDLAGSHPFSGRPSNAVKIVRLTRQVLNRRGYKKVPMWLTELTWSSAKGKKDKLTQNWETTESGQAQRLTQVYRLLIRSRRSLRLERVFWYTWATVDEGSPNSFDYSGLVQIRPDGSERDKPSLAAFRALAK